MMQEIKFRAWHKELKQMFSAEEMGQDQLTLMPDGRGFANISGISTKLSQIDNGHKMIPLLYTGLKDKNGKECYNQDICKDDFDSIWLVEWSDEYARFELTLLKSEIGEFPKLNICRVVDMMEIISNSFESPELLEASSE